MELSKQSESGVYLLYTESFWTGKRRLTVDGKEAAKIAKKMFRAEGEDGSVDYTVKGSFLTGVTVTSSGGERIVLAKNSWYDWLILFLSFAGIVVGVLCGMVGAAFSAICCVLAAIFNATISRSRLNLALKILLHIVIIALANAVWFGMYCVVVMLVLY